jgi:hypothetical protein
MYKQSGPRLLLRLGLADTSFIGPGAIAALYQSRPLLIQRKFFATSTRPTFFFLMLQGLALQPIACSDTMLTMQNAGEMAME